MRVACVGEAMVELSRVDLPGGRATVGVAGDTYNMAVYLARLLGPGAVSYLTVLGSDALSDGMVSAMRAEGIDTALVGRHPERLPGLYAIELDGGGERSFRYWREASAARTLFGGVGATFEDLATFDVVALSGITLAILPPDLRSALLARLRTLGLAGRGVVFDGNYRPRLWPDATTARESMDAAWATATIALPSFDDEVALRPGLSPSAALARIAALGAGEVVLKNGAAGPSLASGPLRLPAASRVVDTSGAGDSFGAAYLAARLRGEAPDQAARAGHALACVVVAHPGAVIPRGAMPQARS